MWRDNIAAQAAAHAEREQQAAVARAEQEREREAWERSPEGRAAARERKVAEERARQRQAMAEWQQGRQAEINAIEDRGVRAFQAGDYREAMRWFKISATEHGNVQANVLVGACYTEMNNPTEAMRWLRRGAELGCSSAQYGYAIRRWNVYRSGGNPMSPQNREHFRVATYWMQQAHNQGVREATEKLQEWVRIEQTEALQGMEDAVRDMNRASDMLRGRRP